MALRITDVRCPHCGQKLAKTIWFLAGGGAIFECRRCKKEVRIEDKPGGPASKTE